jgi:hypothetical protein
VPQSFDTLRVGHKYEMVNLGVKVSFIILERKEEMDFMVKDLETLEIFMLTDLIKYGMGGDYALNEIGRSV